MISKLPEIYPVDIRRILNVYKTFRRHPRHLLNVLSAFILHPVSRDGCGYSIVALQYQDMVKIIMKLTVNSFKTEAVIK